jgi:hypothetical protein
MAICRWSSDDFKCDLYIYQTVYGGIQVEIAGNHSNHDPSVIDWPEDLPLAMLKEGMETPIVAEWANKMVAARRQLFDMLDTAERTLIDHPHAGGSFRFETAEEVVEFLEKEIIPSGKFIVPEWLISELQKWELIEDDDESAGETS